ncbi:hypothetical protein [Serratia ureilytica]|uniref:hypothetical protein n=1 Tax=Serratia ureilytica TaxID=300181 RepID=UPI0018DA16B0|nr:hypothetical protein [Serratia ureilytica]MBH3122417.1 hypothetical protein [Serratia ureilytica]
MSKSLISRCIRRWNVHFKPICNSKVSPYWRKRDLKRYIRESAFTTAASMVEEMAEGNAKVDFNGESCGWSPEFSAFYNQHREQYLKEARDFLNEEINVDEIDVYIESEIDCWSD